MPLALFFFLKIALALCGLLCFHTNFRIVYFISGKNAIGILIETALILQTALDNIENLTILILSIMSTEYLDVYLCLLQYLSLMSYSFQCIGLSPPWLPLFLGIFFFSMLL